MNNGETMVGASGHGKDELHAPKSDAQIAEKFRSLSEDYLGTKQVSVVLEQLWRIEEAADVALIPPAFVIA